MSSKIAVVILAGGEGRRIGGAKPLRTLSGERLIDRAVRQARPWSDRVAIAVRDPAQVETAGADLVLDEPEVRGPLGGLMAALAYAQRSGCGFVLTIPADMPFLPRDLPSRLFARLEGGACALASSGGQLHPVCGLWRTEVLRQVGSYLEGERRSLKGLAEFVGFRAVEWPVGEVDPFFNINSADDLERAERLA
jgi:molybdopterin-guanine dinucleotide biosynthesis protein A